MLVKCEISSRIIFNSFTINVLGRTKWRKRIPSRSNRKCLHAIHFWRDTFDTWSQLKWVIFRSMMPRVDHLLFSKNQIQILFSTFSVYIMLIKLYSNNHPIWNLVHRCDSFSSFTIYWIFMCSIFGGCVHCTIQQQQKIW